MASNERDTALRNAAMDGKLEVGFTFEIDAFLPALLDLHCFCSCDLSLLKKMLTELFGFSQRVDCNARSNKTDGEGVAV